MMRELIRFLFFLFVLLPLALVFIGPLLILAALRGAQQVGPIIFNPGRRGIGGRGLASLLGLTLWLGVWGGLALLLLPGGLPALVATPAPTLSDLPTATETAQLVVEAVNPTFTPTPSVLPTPTAQPTAAPTPVSTLSPVPSPTPLPSMATPSLSSTPIPTPTPLPPTATPTLTSTPTPRATLSPDEANQVVDVVEAANALLRAAVIQPSIGNLAELETYWQGEALAQAQAFAQDLYERYLRPLEVSFVYVVSPVAAQGASSDEAVVTSTEAWTYEGPLSSHSESFEFVYTLNRKDGGWVITDYSYRYVSPDFLSPTISVTTTVTSPVTITP